MTLGEGIFYSSLFLGVIGLYIATKDRWRWKRIILWPLGLIAVVAAGVGIFAYIESLPTAQTEFWGIGLGEKKEEVRFRKGEPQQANGKSWTYTLNSQSGDIAVKFEGDEVACVYFSDRGAEQWSSPSLLGIRVGDSTAKATQRLGEPTKIRRDYDGMLRAYEFHKYNVHVVFFNDEAKRYGICGDKHGFPSGKLYEVWEEDSVSVIWEGSVDESRLK